MDLQKCCDFTTVLVNPRLALHDSHFHFLLKMISAYWYDASMPVPPQLFLWTASCGIALPLPFLQAVRFYFPPEHLQRLHFFCCLLKVNSYFGLLGFYGLGLTQTACYPLSAIICVSVTWKGSTLADSYILASVFSFLLLTSKEFLIAFESDTQQAFSQVSLLTLVCPYYVGGPFPAFCSF